MRAWILRDGGLFARTGIDHHIGQVRSVVNAPNAVAVERGLLLLAVLAIGPRLVLVGTTMLRDDASYPAGLWILLAATVGSLVAGWIWGPVRYVAVATALLGALAINVIAPQYALTFAYSATDSWANNAAILMGLLLPARWLLVLFAIYAMAYGTTLVLLSSAVSQSQIVSAVVA